ncbi:hypothetical protein KAR91_75025 [Candidatus Pacearchaeota archaeon]|nr:hypothetical protein [Candidatus Pacearchaeota archaeon]
MNLDKVRLRGFKGIKKGLGVDEIEIDLSGLKGLVALSGDNGAGKTTFLENCQPFRVMPSKKSPLYHQVFLRDSYRDLSFRFEDDHYRTLVKIDSYSEKSEGFIWKNDHPEVDGKVTNYDNYLTNLLGSQNLFFNSIFCAQKAKKISGLTTGKLKELFSEFLRLYELVAHEATSNQCTKVLNALIIGIDKEIDSLLYRSKNRAELERELTEAEFNANDLIDGREALINEIENAEKNLIIINNDLTKSLVKKEKLSDLEHNNYRIVKEILELRYKSENRSELENELSEAEAGGVALISERENLTKEIEDTEKRLVVVNTDLTKSLIKKGRLSDLEQNLARMKEEKGKAFESVEDDLNRLRNTLRGINDELEQCESLLKDKDKIYEAYKRERDILWQLPIVKNDIEYFQNELNTNESEKIIITRKIDDNRRIIDAGKSDPEITRLETEIRSKREKTDDLEKRDPECKSEICQFIVGALKASDELPKLETKLLDTQQTIHKQINAATAIMADMGDKLLALNKKYEDILKAQKSGKEKKQQLDDELKQTRLFSTLKAGVDVAVSQKEGIETRKATTTKDGIRIKDSRDKAISIIEEDISKLYVEIATLKSAIDNTLEEKRDNLDLKIKESRLVLDEKISLAIVIGEKKALLKQSIENQIIAGKELEVKKDEESKLSKEIGILKDTIDNDLDEKKDRLDRELKESKNTLNEKNKQVAELGEKKALLKQSIEEKMVAEKELKAKKEEKNKLIHEHSEWIYIKNACSKNGIQALEIDGVAPLITENANKLLNMNFGPNDSVKFMTQDEEGREIFDILILRKGGESVLLDDLSGGEEVWILKALRLAMTLISNEKSGKQYKSIFCDEDDGSLSVENAVKFIYLYKMLMKIAGMDTCFYISHKKEAVELANHVLMFGNGKIQLM